MDVGNVLNEGFIFFSDELRVNKSVCDLKGIRLELKVQVYRLLMTIKILVNLRLDDRRVYGVYFLQNYNIEF